MARHRLNACDYCRGDIRPGWIEQDNNGPIVPCPVCNPIPQITLRREREWDLAVAQREGRF